jgi:3',5'-cyclic-AMP phosphodiesterase
METLRRVLLFLCLPLLTHCEFEYSPYTAAAPEIKSNQVNLRIIQQAEADSPDEFKVAFISDTHNYYQELQQLVRALNANGPYAFVAVGGDITNIGLLSEFQEALRHFQRLRWPFLVVPGNHDLVANGMHVFYRMFGELDFSLSFKNTKFVFYNNNNWETPGEAPSYAWVFEQLRESNEQFKILVAHVPPADSERFSTNLIDNWRNMVNSEGVNYVFSGHNHGPGVSSFGTAVNVTIGSPVHRSYFELTISPGSIEHQQINF